jgi:tripartite ATP-independent transporter DctP family solute receptor
MRQSWLAGMAVTFFVAVSVAPASAVDITIRAGLTDPLDTPYGEAMLEFKRIVEEGSQKRIEVQLFPSAQLGAIPEQLENVKVGGQEMSLFSPAYAGQFFPAFDVLELPFLVTNWDEAQRMLKSDAFKRLTSEAAKAIGVKIVGTFPYGFRNIANSKHPVRTLQNFSGLKLRVQNSPVHIAAFRALGANPVAIGWDETYQAVQTGVVDGLENANTVLIANRYPEIAKYVSRTGHLFGMLLVSMNTKLYDSLSPADQKLIIKGMEAAEAINLARALEIDKSSVDTLTKMGAVVNDVSPEAVQEMRKAVQPVLDEFGPKFQPHLDALTAAAAGK